jgi:hypothetical protein
MYALTCVKVEEERIRKANLGAKRSITQDVAEINHKIITKT